MKFTEELINTYANNLMFRLNEEEITDLITDLVTLETKMDYLNKNIDLNDVEILSHPFDLDDVKLREDIASESISTEEAFKNTKKVTNGEIEVPRVVN